MSENQNEVESQDLSPDNPEAPITMRQLLEAGVHFGHQTKRWNPKMKPYIFGARNGIHIIDLQHTVRLFNRAFNFIVNTVASGGSILFVGTKKQAQEVMQQEAVRGGQFHVTNRWLGGTLTNFRTVKGSIDRLKSLEKMAEDGTFERLAKKEVLMKMRERDKLEKALGGIKNLSDVPSAIYVIDANYQNRGELFLAHQFNGLEVDVAKAREVLANVRAIWGRPAHLALRLDEDVHVITCDADGNVKKEKFTGQLPGPLTGR